MAAGPSPLDLGLAFLQHAGGFLVSLLLGVRRRT
jgi:hypothetical protein